MGRKVVYDGLRNKIVALIMNTLKICCVVVSLILLVLCVFNIKTKFIDGGILLGFSIMNLIWCLIIALLQWLSVTGL